MDIPIIKQRWKNIAETNVRMLLVIRHPPDERAQGETQGRLSPAGRDVRQRFSEDVLRRMSPEARDRPALRIGLFATTYTQSAQATYQLAGLGVEPVYLDFMGPDSARSSVIAGKLLEQITPEMLVLVAILHSPQVDKIMRFLAPRITRPTDISPCKPGQGYVWFPKEESPLERVSYLEESARAV